MQGIWIWSLVRELQTKQWHPTPLLLPGKSHGSRSLLGCSPRGIEESDTTEWLHFHFSLSCTGEGNGNPLQCSGLENPRDGGAWWAAVYGVSQSRTRLKRLSSSSSSSRELRLLMPCGVAKKKKRNCILESPDKHVHLTMLIKKSGTKLIKILSKECYKYIMSMKRRKAERKYIKMI